jgi:hypothetical protein
MSVRRTIAVVGLLFFCLCLTACPQSTLSTVSKAVHGRPLYSMRVGQIRPPHTTPSSFIAMKVEEPSIGTFTFESDFGSSLLSVVRKAEEWIMKDRGEMYVEYVSRKIDRESRYNSAVGRKEVKVMRTGKTERDRNRHK